MPLEPLFKIYKKSTTNWLIETNKSFAFTFVLNLTLPLHLHLIAFLIKRQHPVDSCTLSDLLGIADQLINLFQHDFMFALKDGDLTFFFVVLELQTLHLCSQQMDLFFLLFLFLLWLHLGFWLLMLGRVFGPNRPLASRHIDNQVFLLYFGQHIFLIHNNLSEFSFFLILTRIKASEGIQIFQKLIFAFLLFLLLP